MKNTLQVVNSRLNEADEQISDLEDNVMESHCYQTEKSKNNEKERGQFKKSRGQHQTC